MFSKDCRQLIGLISFVVDLGALKQVLKHGVQATLESTSKINPDSDMANSMRVSMLSRSVHTRASIHDNKSPSSSTNSICSVAHSTTSLSFAASANMVSA